jgi:hypothetical protein
MEQASPFGVTISVNDTSPTKPAVDATVIVTGGAADPSTSDREGVPEVMVKSPTALTGVNITEATIIPMINSGRNRTIVQFFN